MKAHKGPNEEKPDGELAALSDQFEKEKEEFDEEAARALLAHGWMNFKPELENLYRKAGNPGTVGEKMQGEGPEDFPRTFAVEKGVIAVVDSEGKKRIAPFDRGKQDDLVALGFKEVAMHVPYANGEEPESPAQKARWITLRSEQEKKNRQKALDSQSEKAG